MSKLVFLQANFLFALFPSNYHSWKCIFFGSSFMYVIFSFLLARPGFCPLPSTIHTTCTQDHIMPFHATCTDIQEWTITFSLNWGCIFSHWAKACPRIFLTSKIKIMTPERTSLKLFLCGFPCKSFFQQFLLCRNFFWPSPPPLKSDGPFCMFCES